MSEYLSEYTGSQIDDLLTRAGTLSSAGKAPSALLADTATVALSCSGNATTATTCTGNSATATKLATARTISLTGIVTGSVSFDGSANSSISTTVNGGNTILLFSNKTIATSAWASDSTYDDYPYVATVTCANVTTSYFPEVAFSLTDATSGIFAPICESVSGGVKVWVTEVPSSTITIPSIKCTKAMS